MTINNSCSFDFRGVHALVTGGTSGIGHAIAVALASSGAAVTATGTRPDAFAYEPLRLPETPASTPTS